MRLWVLFSLLPLVLFSSSVQAEELPLKKETEPVMGSVKNWTKDSQIKINFPVEKYTLDNGLTVLLHVDRTVPMVSYHTWYKVGSRDEGPGYTGSAHMLEHMMFKGAKKYSGKDFDRILHENGIVNNAFTSNDFTGFYQILPSSKLELMMDMEVDRMTSLNLSPEDLKSELQVVSEERRFRVDNNPMGLLREELMSTTFKAHPYRWPVIGYMKDIWAYTPETLRKFYENYYGPNNAILILSGNFDSSSAKKLIKKYYGPLPKREVPTHAVVIEPDQTSARYRELVRGEVSTPSVLMSFRSQPAGHEDNYALDLLAAILGEGQSSRLYDILVFKKSIATAVHAGNRNLREAGMFEISMSLKPGQDVSVASSAVTSELEKIKKSGVTEKELEKAKNQVMLGYVMALDTIDRKSYALATNEILFGDYGRLFSDLDKYSQIQLKDVQAVANKYFTTSKRVTLNLLPKGGE